MIGLSGCLKGEINSALAADQYPRALELAGQYRDILGAENFFIEMQDHGIEAQLKANRLLPKVAKELGPRARMASKRRAFFEPQQP